MTITDKQAMRDAIDTRFRSGNSVPIDRAHITASEWQKLRAALEAAEAARDAPEDRAALVRHAIKLMQQSPPWDGKTFSPELSHTLKLLAAAPSSAEQPAKTDRHARIGSTTFNPGVPVEVVIGRAYDEYDYRKKEVMQTGTQQPREQPCDTRPVDVAPINEAVGATPGAPEADERDTIAEASAIVREILGPGGGLRCDENLVDMLRTLQCVVAASAAPSVAPVSERGEPVAIHPSVDRYFSFSDSFGFDTHATADSARKAAQEALDECRDNADDGWPEETDNICFGVMLGGALVVSRTPIPEHALARYDASPGDNYIQYGLADFAAPVSAQDGDAVAEFTEERRRAYAPASPAGPEDRAVYDRIAQGYFDSVAPAVPATPGVSCIPRGFDGAAAPVSAPADARDGEPPEVEPATGPWQTVENKGEFGWPAGWYVYRTTSTPAGNSTEWMTQRRGIRPFPTERAALAAIDRAMGGE